MTRDVESQREREKKKKRFDGKPIPNSHPLLTQNSLLLVCSTFVQCIEIVQEKQCKNSYSVGGGQGTISLRAHSSADFFSPLFSFNLVQVLTPFPDTKREFRNRGKLINRPEQMIHSRGIPGGEASFSPLKRQLEQPRRFDILNEVQYRESLHSYCCVTGSRLLIN